jgi:glycosyltransferase involved in cell wall biosynthesis
VRWRAILDALPIGRRSRESTLIVPVPAARPALEASLAVDDGDDAPDLPPHITLPHLTVATGDQPTGLVSRLEQLLPIEATATEVWLLTQEENGRWSTRKRCLLGGAASGERTKARLRQDRPLPSVRGMDAPRKLRVHALITSLTWGGAEMLLSEFAAGAPAAGIELSVSYLQELDGSPGAQRLRRHGVEPTFASIKSSHPLVSPSDFMLVRRHLAAARPDILHTHLGYADTLGGVAARSLGIPAVCTLHESNWAAKRGKPRDYSRERLIAFARRRCMATVIAVSEQARRAYLEMGWDRPERVLTVHNGLYAPAQPGAGATIRAELGLDSSDLVIVMLSVLRRKKGHAIAVEAVRALHERFPQLKLVIAGEGADRPEIEASAASLGSAAVMAGHRDDVMAVLDAADVLVHPSMVDAFPTALLEAMAAGLPVVATAVGGIPEIVEDGATGFLIDAPPRPDRLAEVLAPLLERAELRRELGTAGRKRFEQQFTAERWAQRTRSIYEAALS